MSRPRPHPRRLCLDVSARGLSEAVANEVIFSVEQLKGIYTVDSRYKEHWYNKIRYDKVIFWVPKFKISLYFIVLQPG